VAIGDLNESALHAELKRALAPPGARFEVRVDGYVVDAVSDGLLIEVQTRHIGKLRPKLERLLPLHEMRVVVPVANQRWIVRRGPEGEVRRRSPKRADLLDALAELVGIPRFLDHPNLEIEVVLVHDEETRERRAGASWRRRGWMSVERRLLAVTGRERLRGARAWLRALPPSLPERFTTLDLAAGRTTRRGVARRAAFVLREAGVIVPAGRSGRSPSYQIAPPT